jgi:hypothetical protein
VCLKEESTHVVDDDVDSLHIDTSSEDIGCNEDTLLERLERRVSADSVYSEGEVKVE